VARIALQPTADGGLELERHLVAAEMPGIGGRKDPGQAGQVAALVPARLTAVEMRTERQTVLVGQLADDLHGQQTVPVIAPVAGH
jgi:hypothetical protein